MATKFYSVPLVVDFPHSWFLVPETFWQANPFSSNAETELCCPIHKWRSNILWILVVVQVGRQSLLGHHRFAIWIYHNYWLPSESSCSHMNPYYALNDQQEYKVRCCHCEGELLWDSDESMKSCQSRRLWLILSVCIRPSTSVQATRPLSILKNWTKYSCFLWHTENLTFSFRRFHCCSLEPNSSALLLGKSRSPIRSFNSSCVIWRIR